MTFYLRPPETWREILEITVPFVPPSITLGVILGSFLFAVFYFLIKFGVF